MPATRLSLTSALPAAEPPNTKLKTPLGAPASWMISAIAAAMAGVSEADFNTTVFPNASAGALFQAGMAMGKFQGVINPKTPSASR